MFVIMQIVLNLIQQMHGVKKHMTYPLGGVLLTDNVLWHGKILESSENQDRVTRLIDNFNKKILEDKSLKTVMLPIRDGISLTLKL